MAPIECGRLPVRLRLRLRRDRLRIGGLPGRSQRSWRSLVGPERVERSTSRLSGVRSNHLSYEPDEVCRLRIRAQQHPRAIARTFDEKGRETKGAARFAIVVLVPMSGIPRESRA